MKVVNGSCKTVFVFKTFVIKIPSIFNGLSLFYYGCHCNLEERKWKKALQFSLPRIHYVNPLGLFCIQEYCRPLTDTEWKNIGAEKEYTKRTYEAIRFENFEDIDFKRENFGFSPSKNRIVLLDWI